MSKVEVFYIPVDPRVVGVVLAFVTAGIVALCVVATCDTGAAEIPGR